MNEDNKLLTFFFRMENDREGSTEDDLTGLVF